MATTEQLRIVCHVCKKQLKAAEAVCGERVREPIAETIRKSHPGWTSQECICLADLNYFRAKYVQDALEMEKGELVSLEAEVVQSERDHEFLSKNINVEFEKQLKMGERIADSVASFGGSWKFIISFGGVLIVWIIINSLALLRQPFDPYPYILLNLVLSCLSSLQGPVILMSQNRQDAKDRLRSEHDYRVNMKAELEIRHLNAKMDLLLTQQWRRLMEIQEIQMELMQEHLQKK